MLQANGNAASKLDMENMEMRIELKFNDLEGKFNKLENKVDSFKKDMQLLRQDIVLNLTIKMYTGFIAMSGIIIAAIKYV